MKNTIKNLMASALAAVTLYAAPVQAQDNNIFIGIQNNEAKQTVGSRMDFNRTDGTQIILESIDTPFGEKQAHVRSIGARTPFLFDKLRLSAITDINANDDYSGTAFAEYKINPVTIRAGAFKAEKAKTKLTPEVSSLGGFAGAKYKDKIFASAELGHDGTDLTAHGFVSYVISDKLYLSAGGQINPTDKGLTTSQAWMNKNNPGFFNEARFTFKDEKPMSYAGRFYVMDKITDTRFLYDDLRGIYWNNLDMETMSLKFMPWVGLNDGFSTNHLGAGIRYSEDEKVKSVNPKVYIRPAEQLVLATGYGNVQDKTKSTIAHNLSFDVAAKASGLEATVLTETNLETGSTSVTGYAGYKTDF